MITKRSKMILAVAVSVVAALLAVFLIILALKHHNEKQDSVSNMSSFSDYIADADALLEEETPKEEPVLFYNPVNGEVLKKYSMDALVYSETMEDYRVHNSQP